MLIPSVTIYPRMPTLAAVPLSNTCCHLSQAFSVPSVLSSFSERLLSALGGSYTIERELTGGGMALVFVGEDHDLGRKVVIKILPPELAASVSAERFRREIGRASCRERV